jgi:hypothetical protein
VTTSAFAHVCSPSLTRRWSAIFFSKPRSLKRLSFDLVTLACANFEHTCTHYNALLLCQKTNRHQQQCADVWHLRLYIRARVLNCIHDGKGVIDNLHVKKGITLSLQAGRNCFSGCFNCRFMSGALESIRPLHLVGRSLHPCMILRNHHSSHRLRHTNPPKFNRFFRSSDAEANVSDKRPVAVSRSHSFQFRF